ncbi:MAG: uracil phosphoribosyltransferase [Bacteroidales bacterium]|nr:uracil phosphoribosyltransferase [Bacteroidales bacterium]
MKIVDLSKENCIVSQYMAELRDKKVQKDSMRFRLNMERIGMYAAMEISKTLSYKETQVQTPLGIAQCKTLEDKVVISSILRAGLTIHNGVLQVFDKAENSFIAAYRKYGNDNKFLIQMEYMSRPPMEGKVLILTDCMIATGSSLLLAYNKLIDDGEPKHTHIVASIVSEAALSYLSKQLPHKRVTLWVGAVDEELTNKAYIIPGLGDAGDLAYGEKL